MSKSIKSQIFRQIEMLPALPATVSRVMSVVADSESSGDDLVAAILPDQTMCTTILKIANSAFFGMPREVSTMEKAVNILGFNEVHNIVLGKAVFNSFQKIGADKKEVDAFWNHSFQCGLATKIIAEDRSLPASELFIAGLIHDIGRLVLYMSKAITSTAIFDIKTSADFFNFCDREVQEFDVDHAELGLHILTRWMFPEKLLSAVGYHHSIFVCDKHQLYAVIVNLADTLDVMLSLEQTNPIDNLYEIITYHQPGIQKIWNHHQLDIDEAQLQKWKDRLRDSISRDGAILGIFNA